MPSKENTASLQEPVRKRRKLSTRRKLLFTFIIFLMTVFAAEGAVRMRQWMRYGGTRVGEKMIIKDDALGTWYPRAGYERKASKIWIKINSLGFRGDEFSKEKPAGTIRIACLGASTTFCGEASSNDMTWPAQLQALLREKYPDKKIEVINAAVSGWRVKHSLINLKARVLVLKPDLVILYHANNDIASDTEALARSRKLIPEKKDDGGFINWLGEYSVLVDLVDKNMKIQAGKHAQSTGKLTEVPKDLSDGFISKFDEVHQTLKEKNIPLVLGAFQTKYRRDQSRDIQTTNADVAFFYMPWMSIEALLDVMDQYNNRIVAFAKERSIPVLTDRDRIPADEKHFADCMHFHDAGCTVMAQRYAEFLAESGVMDRVIEASNSTSP